MNRQYHHHRHQRAAGEERYAHDALPTAGIKAFQSAQEFYAERYRFALAANRQPPAPDYPGCLQYYSPSSSSALSSELFSPLNLPIESNRGFVYPQGERCVQRRSSSAGDGACANERYPARRHNSTLLQIPPTSNNSRIVIAPNRYTFDEMDNYEPAHQRHKELFVRLGEEKNGSHSLLWTPASISSRPKRHLITVTTNQSKSTRKETANGDFEKVTQTFTSQKECKQPGFGIVFRSVNTQGGDRDSAYESIYRFEKNPNKRGEKFSFHDHGDKDLGDGVTVAPTRTQSQMDLRRLARDGRLVRRTQTVTEEEEIRIVKRKVKNRAKHRSEENLRGTNLSLYQVPEHSLPNDPEHSYPREQPLQRCRSEVTVRIGDSSQMPQMRIVSPPHFSQSSHPSVSSPNSAYSTDSCELSSIVSPLSSSKRFISAGDIYTDAAAH